MNSHVTIHSDRQASRFQKFALVAAFFVLFGSAAVALEPAEVALVAAEGSSESQALAKYYCQQRGVPLENICLVAVPKGEVLDRSTWQKDVRPAIRSWLMEGERRERIKCLVTLWDVPLKIAPADASELKPYREALRGERDRRLLLMKQIASELDSIAKGEPLDTSTKLRAQDTLSTLTLLLEGKLQEAQTALSQQAAGDPLELAAKRQRLQQLATQVGGLRVILQGLKVRINQSGTNTPANLIAEFSLLRGRALGYEEARALLELQPAGPNRDLAALELLERSVGLLGAVEWLNNELDTAKKNETGASFDSELSLVLWPEDYHLLRWQPNDLRAGLEDSPLRATSHTLMVSRIDGPSLAIAKRLIDDAMAVEKAGGLKGKVYLDARGLAKSNPSAEGQRSLKPGSYEDFDQSLLKLAEGLRQTEGMEVVLDQSPELFGPGDCPETALYCGWYSLANYVDAFDFERGAVAMHLASAEAKTLREENVKNWCKCLLDDGVSATIGPVYEPYLLAFPRPDAFFKELTGGNTLVESYYRTKPFNSWMMVLVGDPLYRPY